MRTMIRFTRDGQYRNVRFPCTERELQILMDSLELPNTAATELIVDSVHDDSKLNTLLSGREHNLDELNYLFKRLDSFGDNEMNTFCAVAKGQKLKSLKDMINLTFNTHCYSLVDNFSSLDRLGRDLYRNHAISYSTEEWAHLDGNAYVEKIMEENPHPMITPYGIVYENANYPEMVYNGKTFPAFWYEPSPFLIELGTKTEKEYLYLPAENSELEKALQRLGVNTLSDVSINVKAHEDLPGNIADLVLTNINEVDALNSYAIRFKELGERNISDLYELVEFTGIKSSEQLSTLIDCMHEFEIFPNIHTAEQYGKYMICESGRFEYDSNLEDYIDFEAYGKDKISHETGVFTVGGYLLYHGYNVEMQNILCKNLGMKIKESQEQTELKLYMPLKVITYHDENGYGDFCQVDFEIELDTGELYQCDDKIRDAMEDRMDDEKRGLMDYYHEHDSVNAKVLSYFFDVEEVGGRLMGVAVLTLNAPLDAAELEKIKDAITGQASDGFGEGLEQREINCNGRDVYVSLWNSKNWSLQTAEELGITQPMQGMGGMNLG